MHKYIQKCTFICPSLVDYIIIQVIPGHTAAPHKNQFLFPSCRSNLTVRALFTIKRVTKDTYHCGAWFRTNSRLVGSMLQILEQGWLVPCYSSWSRFGLLRQSVLTSEFMRRMQREIISREKLDWIKSLNLRDENKNFIILTSGLSQILDLKTFIKQL